MHEPQLEDPEVTITQSNTKNLLLRLWTLARIGGFGYLLGYSIYLAFQVASGIPLLFTFILVGLLLRELWLLARVERKTYRFFDQVLHVERRTRRSEQETRYDYRAIRHVALVGLRDFLIETYTESEGRTHHQLRLSRRQGEDTFDTCIELVRAAYPDHMFSIRESAGLSHSIEPSVPALFPQLAEAPPLVREAAVSDERVCLSNGDLATHPPDYEVCRTRFTLIEIIHGKRFVELRDQTLRSGAGVVVGELIPGTHGTKRVKLFDGHEYLMSRAGITRDGEPFARLPGWPKAAKILFLEPVPPAVALLITLVLGE